MQIINPFLILTCVPIFEMAFYPCLKLFGVQRFVAKMTIGGIFAAVAFLLAAAVQTMIDEDHPEKVSILWQIPQYVFLTFGEAMFSVTGLLFTLTEVPSEMKMVRGH